MPNPASFAPLCLWGYFCLGTEEKLLPFEHLSPAKKTFYQALNRLSSFAAPNLPMRLQTSKPSRPSLISEQ